jgi:hypothetical protein
VEIDALVAVWLGMDIDALIAIYSAAFPLLNRYEEITSFDSAGYKIAGYHSTFGQIQKKGDYEAMLEFNESDGTTKVPDGYTPPFCKAGRIAEYRQAHAAFTARMRGV